jgi:hypothetical protein
MWDKWVEVTAQTVLLDREEALQNAVRRFGRREEYAYSEEAIAAMQPGRQRLLMFEKCRARLLAQMAKPVTKKSDAGMGIRLSYEQTRLFNVMRDTMLLRFYGGDVKEYMRDIEFILGVVPHAMDIYSKAAVILPRRSGKTLVQSTVGACTLLSQPTGNVLAYNMTNQQGIQWQKEVVNRCKLLKNDPDFAWNVAAEHNGKYVEFNRTGIVHGTNTTLYVFGNARDARNAQNLRSTGANALLVALDEGMFFCSEAYQVILPTIANGAAMVITSSTPPYNSPALGMLTSKLPNGRPVLRTINWRKQCLACENREKKTQTEVECHHHASRPLHFRSRTDEEILEALMRPFGDAYATEMLNRGHQSNAKPYFDAEAMNDLFDTSNDNEEEDSNMPLPPHVIPGLSTTSRYFLVSCDPGGQYGTTTTGSDWTLTSAVFTRVLPGQPALDSPPKGDVTQLYCVVRSSSSSSWPIHPCAPGGGKKGFP